MSFVERNKLWLLPTLVVGVAAVAWFNYQSFSGPKSAEPSPAPIAGQSSEVAPPDSNPAPAPAQEAPTEASGVWDDLKPLAFVPGDLNRLDALDTQARASLPGAALRESPSDLIRLGGPKMWEAPSKAHPSGEGSPDPAPLPDILIQLPEGSRVWFDGVGYREKQELGRAPWKVRKIHPKAVELQGPGGTEVKSIHPAPNSDPKEGP
ncbi:MAG: hypothetical protein HYZ13_04345 [Acidobacteria bacterium]|nr:hypothetical protein [Acidobacteriota bacterium]